MDKSIKLYKKAMSNYYEGKLDRALKLCEKSISLNYKNAAAMNLKGLIYYLKGDLSEARNTWQMNYKANKDGVSKKYLVDSRKDFEYEDLFLEAEKSIRNLNITEALENLKKCKKSDFNIININCSLAVCYIKKGEYDLAVELIDETFEQDKYNIKACELRKELCSYGILKRKVNIRAFKAIFVVLCICLVLAAGTIITIKLVNRESGQNITKLLQNNINTAQKEGNEENKNNFSGNNDENNDILIENQKEENIKVVTESSISVHKKEDFPYKVLNEALEEKNIEEINSIVLQHREEKLGINESVIMNKAIKIMNTDGISYYYKKGRIELKNGKNENAVEYFLKVDNYFNDYSLCRDNTYFLAVSYKNLGNIENAIKYYEKFEKNYKEGSYRDEVLYSLAIIYRDISLDKAKIFAEKIREEIPNSYYYNSKIREILE